MAVTSTKSPARSSRSRTTTARSHHPSDDEILGIVTSIPKPAGSFDDTDSSSAAPSAQSSNSEAAVNSAQQNNSRDESASDSAGQQNNSTPSAEISPAVAQALEAHPELRQAWDASRAYAAIFPTPAAAADARHQLAQLDSLFFSAQPADHAALAARIHELSPEAFHGLARAMHAHAAAMPSHSAAHAGAAESAANSAPAATAAQNSAPASSSTSAASENSVAAAPPAPPQSVAQPAAQSAAAHSPAAAPASAPADPQQAARIAFFHDTNAVAVKQILGAIESQVDHLLPSSASAATRTRLVGEIYRDLDAALRSNQQLGKQLRDAFASGPADAAHQRAIVTLVTGRARQALPAVARRVVGEWTGSVVGAHHERAGRQQSAASRVDISGAGSSDGVNRKPISPRDLNYRKLSDADILNL